MEIKDIIFIYYNILIKFTNYFLKNYDYDLIIYNNGILTLTHIFKFSILTGKPIIETCEKSIYYYFEFITQLKNNSNELINLNTKDACIFIIKKFFNTSIHVYEKKNNIMENKITLQYIHHITEIIKQIINHLDISQPSKNINSIKKIIKKLEFLDINKLKVYHDSLLIFTKVIKTNKEFIKCNCEFIDIIKTLNKKSIMIISANIYKFTPSISIKNQINQLL